MVVAMMPGFLGVFTVMVSVRMAVFSTAMFVAGSLCHLGGFGGALRGCIACSEVLDLFVRLVRIHKVDSFLEWEFSLCSIAIVK